MSIAKNKELLRSLTLKDAVGIGLGAIIGAGIFVVTGIAAGVSGPSFIIGLVIAGIIATFNALSSAQLAAAYPFSGGTYEYGYRILNPLFGFSAGWLFLISKITAASVVAIGFGSYFFQLLPVISPLIFSVIAVVLLTAANLFGIRKAGMLNLVIVSITVLSLIYLIVSGLPRVDIKNFKPLAPYGMKGIAQSAAILFFAFTGYARIATLAEEVNEPRKTIPRAIIITIISSIILYLIVSIVAIGVIGTKSMAHSQAPLQVLANSLSTPGIQIVTIIGACTTMLGVLLSQILGISRMMLAMGRRKDLPPFLQRIQGKYHIPQAAIITTGILILLILFTGTFEFIVMSATFTIFLYYSITNIAALKQPREEQRYPKVIPIAGLTGCIAMSVSLPINVIVSGAGLLLTGYLTRIIIHRVYRRVDIKNT